MSDLLKLLGAKKKRKKKHGVGHEVLDEVGDGCGCLGDGCCLGDTILVIGLVGAGTLLGAHKLRRRRD